MNQKTFVSILGDAITFHEGWSDDSLSFKNLNPGNLKENGVFRRFPDFYSGRQELEDDLQAKIAAGLITIRQIISRYAPPSENDTEAYIKSVIQFFDWRNCPFEDTDSLDEYNFLPKKPEVLIVLNRIWKPIDWHLVQQAISLAARNMPQLSFSCRYADADVSPFVIQNGSQGTIPLLALNEQENQKLLADFNGGEEFNILVYDTRQLNKTGLWYGGDTFEGAALTNDPQAAFGQVSYGPVLDADFIGRNLFHELIHQLFIRIGITDFLHEYLSEHGGYAQNLLADLKAVYNEIIPQYLDGKEAVALGEEAAAQPRNKPLLIRFLAKVVDFWKLLLS